MQHHLIHVYEHYERPQAIGNSSKAPWPNLKKLIDPASTAATTTCFFPDLSTMNGFGFQGEACSIPNAHGNSRRIKDCWAVGVEAVDGAILGGSVLVLFGVDRR
jgi:hypothetical protein